MNFEAEDQVMAAYSETKYKRLAEVENKHDPNNFFRLNQNIKPTGGQSSSS